MRSVVFFNYRVSSWGQVYSIQLRLFEFSGVMSWRVKELTHCGSVIYHIGALMTMLFHRKGSHFRK